MDELKLEPALAPFKAVIEPPGSKSLTNRALVLAALAEGSTQLTNVLFADDTLVMLDGLARLGFSLDIDRPNLRVGVHGQGGQIPSKNAELFCGNSGTTIRFLSAVCCLGHGTFILDGVPRMRQRPIRDLIALMQTLGVGVESVGEDDFPPIRIHANGLAGGDVRYESAISSQYLSAMLMVAPFMREQLQVDLHWPQTSWPYAVMTMRLMDLFGHTVELLRDPINGNPKKIVVPVGGYKGGTYCIEPDASNAGYFLAAAAVNSGSSVTIRNLGSSSLQGDVGLAMVLKRMGAKVTMEKDSVTVTGSDTLKGLDVDLADMPDQAQTLAVVALFASGKTTLRGLHTLRVKETDRLAALSAELRKLNAIVEIQDNDTLVIEPPKTFAPATIDTYEDHRMAMSFAVAGTRLPGVTIRDPQCVNKTYPRFFADLDLVLKSKSAG